MQYTVELTIELPRDKVIELFDDPMNLPKWQEGLLSFELMSGTPGHPGAKSKLLFDMGGRKIEMIETVTRRNLPDAFDGTYETEGVFSVVKNRFIELAPERTKWESDNEFKFTTLFMKMMGATMKGAFPKQSLKFMQDFKDFAENGVDIRTKSAK